MSPCCLSGGGHASIVGPVESVSDTRCVDGGQATGASRKTRSFCFVIALQPMSICREWMLHRGNADFAQAKLLLCRSWSCEYCQPIRRRALMAVAAAGEPQRFLTLTVNPKCYADPEQRLRKLSWAWRTIVKRLRRKYGRDAVEYLAVVEETKAGEPHLHILLRGKYLPQKELSQAMQELIESPIVYIERIKSTTHAVRYVAKYIGKKPAQFGTCKRYWQSVNYQHELEYSDTETPADITKWEVWKHGPTALQAWWILQGFEVTECGPETLTAHRITSVRKEDTS